MTVTRTSPIVPQLPSSSYGSVNERAWALKTNQTKQKPKTKVHSLRVCVCVWKLLSKQLLANTRRPNKINTRRDTESVWRRGRKWVRVKQLLTASRKLTILMADNNNIGGSFASPKLDQAICLLRIFYVHGTRLGSSLHWNWSRLIALTLTFCALHSTHNADTWQPNSVKWL